MDYLTNKPIPQRELARIFGCSPKWIRSLADRDIIKRGSRGFDLAEAVVGYTDYLKSKATKGKSAEDRVRAARAEKLELENAQTRRELLPLEEARAIIDSIASETRSQLQGLPTRVTRDLKLRRDIDDEITAALNRIADKVERAADMLEGGDATELFGDDDD